MRIHGNRARLGPALLFALLASCGGGSGEGGQPVAVDDSYTTPQDEALVVSGSDGVLANDLNVQADRMVAFIDSFPEYGELSMDLDGGFSYQPPSAFVGEDSFTYTIEAENFSSEPATVIITVTPRPGAPEAVEDAYTVDEDNTLSVSAEEGLLSNDSDPEGQALSAVSSEAPSHGSVSINSDGSFSYHPEMDFSGEDGFSYRAFDGELSSAPAWVTVTVAPVNDAPVAVADAFTLDEDTLLSPPGAEGLLANDSDVDGDSLSTVLDTPPGHGSLDLRADGTFDYQPDGDFNGSDSFSYHADDGQLVSGSVTVALTVLPVNDAPVAQAASLSTVKNRPLSFLLQASDPELDPLEFETLSQPAHGTLILNPATGGVTYQPDGDYVGPDGFDFWVTDYQEYSEPASIGIDVVPPPPPELDRILPASGPTGRPLQLWGRYFEDTPGTITLGGQAAAIDLWTDGYVVVVIPEALAPGAYDLVLTTAQGSTAPVSFEVLPWIDDIVPRDAWPGDPVTLLGRGFGDSPGGVTVGGTAAALDSWSADSVTIQLPSLAEGGEQPVVLTTQAGMATNPFGALVRQGDFWAGRLTPPVGAGYLSAWTGSEFLIFGGRGYRYDPVSDRWSSMSPENTPSNLAYLSVWTGERWLVIDNQQGSAYDPRSDTWTPINMQGSGIPRYAATAVWTGEEMLVWGGGTNDGVVEEGARYDPQSDSWTPMSTVGAPPARFHHTAVWTGTEMIVWGGELDNQDLDSGGRYDPVEDSWRQLSQVDAPSPRVDHTAVWTGKLMIVYGGVSGNRAYRYDPALDEWSTTADSRWGRKYHLATWTGEVMLVFGGCYYMSSGCAYDNRGERYDPEADSWIDMDYYTSVQDASGMAAAWTGSDWLIWGGGTAFHTYNAGGIYHAVSDSWTAMDRFDDLPPSRHSYSAVWDGSRVLIWGGRTTYSVNEDGYRYDPADDSFVPMAAGPSARYGHAAAWTGERMVIWGGAQSPSGSHSPTDTGAQYDPLTDGWTPTSTVDAPPPAYNLESVWTGEALVVWGGQIESSTPVGSGGRYDPVNDLWLPVSETGAPEARRNHTMVWTGQEVIVWGGQGADGSLQTGGRYDPLNDLWSPLSIVDAPSPRYAHSAVWTGSEMIVWGGYDTDLTNTGGAYDPLSDSWRATSLSDAPTLALHNAVWADGLMIVWGEVHDFWDNPSGAGVLYDPAQDLWISMNLTNNPGARGYTATWTGAEMVVWGPPLAAPARYYP